MANNSVNALRAAARALEEVVIPAVDRSHPLANEQARLVLKYLKLFESRLEYSHDRDRFELHHYVDLARTLLAGPLPDSPSVRAALESGIARGDALLAAAGARAPDLQRAAQSLAGTVSALVRTAADIADPSYDRLAATVLERTEALLDAQRAWFLPQGWETVPRAVPPIDTALSIPAAQ